MANDSALLVRGHRLHWGKITQCAEKSGQSYIQVITPAMDWEIEFEANLSPSCARTPE